MIGRIFKTIFGIPDKKSVRILMYHMVLPQNESFENDLIVTAENLEKQFQIISKKYNALFFKDLETSSDIPDKIILTFDDGYLNNQEYVLPLLEKYHLKATIFIPTALIENSENNTERNLMTFEEIRNLHPEIIEIALHSHQHHNYTQMSLEEAKNDIIKNMRVLDEKGISYTKVLAYPYGKFPKKNPEKKQFFMMLQKLGISAAVRIGNNIDSYPWKNRFEIKRINITYGDTTAGFKRKLFFGKTKL